MWSTAEKMWPLSSSCVNNWEIILNGTLSCDPCWSMFLTYRYFISWPLDSIMVFSWNFIMVSSPVLSKLKQCVKRAVKEVWQYLFSRWSDNVLQCFRRTERIDTDIQPLTTAIEYLTSGMYLASGWHYQWLAWGSDQTRLWSAIPDRRQTDATVPRPLPPQSDRNTSPQLRPASGKCTPAWQHTCTRWPVNIL